MIFRHDTLECRGGRDGGRDESSGSDDLSPLFSQPPAFRGQHEIMVILGMGDSSAQRVQGFRADNP